MTFTVKIQKDSSQFLFGNLEGQLNHHLIEPMLNFERVILNRQENGLQYTRRKQKVFFDAWIDWQKMIYKGSDFQEEIFAGFSWNKKLINRPNFSFSIPWQMTFQHRGGQNTKDTAQVITNINTAIGIDAEWRFKGFLQKLKTHDKFVEIANAYAEKVIVPLNSGCCGMAGDRGFLVPGLTASATFEEAKEVKECNAEGYYSSTKTCEMAMSEAVGANYESILYLIDEAI